MPHRIPALFVAAVMALSGLLLVAPDPALASPGQGKKVAIIVGPVGSQTDSFRAQADQTANAAAATGASVVKVYSPNATWANVRAAVNGAHVIVYLGHGNGFPSPYSSTQNTDRVNGWGLNTSTTNGDADSWSNGTLVYCGEKALLGTLTIHDGLAQRTHCGFNSGTQGITPAPGFVMIYAGACYSPGASESWDPVPTHSVALQRVSNYSRPVLNLGASASFATYHGAATLVDRILRNPTTSFGEIYHAGRPAGPFTDSAHLSVPGARAWLTQSSRSTVYTYAFAGDPNRTPSGGAPLGKSLVVDRYAGADRFATAAAVSAAFFSPGVHVAYVATGLNYPDALAGGAAAAYAGGPVLLVARDSLPAPTVAELRRLNPKKIVVLGGDGVVSNAVASALRSYASTGVVERLAGSNRFETAAAVSAGTFPARVDVAYVATGHGFPDALAGVAASALSGGPILLVGTDIIPPSTQAELRRLQPARISVLGGSGVVSDSVLVQLRSFTTGSVNRLAGSDRFTTGVAISTATFSGAQTVFIATGFNFPDALAGGPATGVAGGPLLLVSPTSLPAAVAQELQRLQPTRVVILGGPAMVSDQVVSQIRALLP